MLYFCSKWEKQNAFLVQKLKSIKFELSNEPTL